MRLYFRAALISLTFVLSPTKGISQDFHPIDFQQMSKKVLPSKKREEILDAASQYLGDTAAEKYKNVDFSEIKSLLADEVEEEVIQEVVAETVDLDKYSDAEILQGIAAKLKPTGVLKSGDSYILGFGKKYVPKGGVLRVRIDGKPFEVKIYEIDERTFTIRLGNTILKKHIYEEASGSAKLSKKQKT